MRWNLQTRIKSWHWLARKTHKGYYVLDFCKTVRMTELFLKGKEGGRGEGLGGFLDRKKIMDKPPLAIWWLATWGSSSSFWRIPNQSLGIKRNYYTVNTIKMKSDPQSLWKRRIEMINPYKLVKFQLSTGITCDPAASSSTLGCSSATTYFRNPSIWRSENTCFLVGFF